MSYNFSLIINYFQQKFNITLNNSYSLMNDKTKRTKYIASKIIELRESVGWSQSELARQTGVTSAAISQIEKGDRMPSLIVLRKLSDAFNVPLTEFTNDSPTLSAEVNKEAQVFFRKFGDIKNLSDADQEMIQSLVKRLKDNENDQS